MKSFREARSRIRWSFPAFTLLLLLSGCFLPLDEVDDGGDGGPRTDGGTRPTTVLGDGSVDVSGRATYDFVPATYNPSTERGTLAFAQASARPVRNAVVQLRQGTSILATTTTDAEGYYAFSLPPGSATATLSIVVLARSASPSIQVEDNTDGDAVWAMGHTLATTRETVNLHAGHGWTGSRYDAARRLAAPFAVLDSMYTAAQAFLAVRDVDFPPLKVNWSPDNVPEQGDKSRGFISTSHYSFSEGEIYVLGKEGVDTDEFDAHVIVHEWGHYFEAQLSRSDSPGGQHGRGDVLDPRLAFGEGYGNALAAMVLPEPVYADTYWYGATLTSFGFSAETAPIPTDDPTPGAFSEATVLRLLYDLYDSGSNEAHDTVALGLGPIYDVLVGSQKSTPALTTIGSFIAGLKRLPGVDTAAVDALLAHYKLGAITTEWGDGDTNLRKMYTHATSLPFSGSVTLSGGHLPNTWFQNQYYVFTGTGGRVTVSATSSYDVRVIVYQQGEFLGGADDLDTGGTETFTLPTTRSGVPYVVVVTGFKDSSGSYPVNISITSP